MPCPENTTRVKIADRHIGQGYPTYIIAEMSANHGGDFRRAEDIIYAAKDAGADAIKLQTYTADTLTIDSNKPCFRIEKGPWKGQTMYHLYKSASTPWEWQPRLAEIAKEIGIDLFSSPFDLTAVDFLEEMHVPAYKIASYEIIELPLIEKAAATGKPLIISTGEATLAEIDSAVRVARNAGNGGVILLKCTSEYPAPAHKMNLKTLPNLQQSFKVPVGLSDHSIGPSAAIIAVALGASVIEKHFILDRKIKTPDSFFSMDSREFKKLVQQIRFTEESLGSVNYAAVPLKTRRSLYAIVDIKKGDVFSEDNVRSIRPGGDGLTSEDFPRIQGRKALKDIECGEIIRWNIIGA